MKNSAIAFAKDLASSPLLAAANDNLPCRLVSNRITPAITAMTYDAFGKRIVKTDASATYLYTYDQDGHYEVSTLSYNLQRDYLNTLGRYIESDPIGLTGGLNTYGYAQQNPLIYNDTLGLCADSDVQCQNAMRAAGLPQWIPPSPKPNPPQTICELTAGAPCKLIFRCPAPIFWKATGFGACEIATTLACPKIFPDKTGDKQ